MGQEVDLDDMCITFSVICDSDKLWSVESTN